MKYILVLGLSLFSLSALGKAFSSPNSSFIKQQEAYDAYYKAREAKKKALDIFYGKIRTDYENWARKGYQTTGRNIRAQKIINDYKKAENDYKRASQAYEKAYARFNKILLAAKFWGWDNVILPEKNGAATTEGQKKRAMK